MLEIFKRCYKNTGQASGIVPPVLRRNVGVNIYMRANINYALHTAQKFHEASLMNMSSLRTLHTSVSSVNDHRPDDRGSIYGKKGTFISVIMSKLFHALTPMQWYQEP
jgi:hypothetical protein